MQDSTGKREGGAETESVATVHTGKQQAAAAARGGMRASGGCCVACSLKKMQAAFMNLTDLWFVRTSIMEDCKLVKC